MKLCQACGHRPATVEFIQVTGDLRREMSLCRECALSIGMRAQVEAFQRLSQLLMQQSQPEGVPGEMRAALATKCSACGLVFEEFVNTGLLGCPRCYQDFGELLTPVLRRMHGVIRQVADEPETAPEIPAREPQTGSESAREDREQIEIELHLALLEEDYEKAAALRDKLRKFGFES